jgi:hypothetical protein
MVFRQLEGELTGVLHALHLVLLVLVQRAALRVTLRLESRTDQLHSLQFRRFPLLARISVPTVGLSDFEISRRADRAGPRASIAEAEMGRPGVPP